MAATVRLPLLLAACITSASSWCSVADDGRDTFLESKHIFMIGGYWQEADAKIRETRDPLPRVGLNLEQLGVDEDDATWYLEYRYRFSDRWTFVGAGQRFTSGGEVGLNRDINFSGIVFPAGVDIRQLAAHGKLPAHSVAARNHTQTDTPVAPETAWECHGRFPDRSKGVAGHEQSTFNHRCIKWNWQGNCSLCRGCRFQSRPGCPID